MITQLKKVQMLRKFGSRVIHRCRLKTFTTNLADIIGSRYTSIPFYNILIGIRSRSFFPLSTNSLVLAVLMFPYGVNSIPCIETYTGWPKIWGCHIKLRTHSIRGIYCRSYHLGFKMGVAMYRYLKFVLFCINLMNFGIFRIYKVLKDHGWVIIK